MTREEWEIIEENLTSEEQKKYLNLYWETYQGQMILFFAHLENIIKSLKR